MKKEFDIKFEPGQRVYQYEITAGDFNLLSRKIEAVIVEMREDRMRTQYVIRGTEHKLNTLYETMEQAYSDALAELTVRRLKDEGTVYEDEDEDDDDEDDAPHIWGTSSSFGNAKKKSKPKKKIGRKPKRRKAMEDDEL
jgi:hypothetical protein